MDPPLLFSLAHVTTTAVPLPEALAVVRQLSALAATSGGGSGASLTIDAGDAQRVVSGTLGWSVELAEL